MWKVNRRQVMAEAPIALLKVSSKQNDMWATQAHPTEPLVLNGTVGSFFLQIEINRNVIFINLSTLFFNKKN
jgi:hypothetical protein